MKTKTRQGSRKTPWHPAFCEAIQQELFEYRDSLEFKFEHPLNAEPLCIDLLIIKKPGTVVIDKNIARIFRADNLLEYKSPGDYLSVNDYLKANAYANLYAAITPNVDFAEITLTFIEYRHPRKLLKYLTETRGYTAEQISPGIYRISGDYLPIQIIESGKLSERENIWLKSLTNGLRTSNAAGIIEEVDKCGNKASLGAYLDVLMRANTEAFKEAKTMARRGLPTLEEALEEIGILPEMIERCERRGKAIGMEKGLEQGMEKGLKIVARNALAEGASIEFVNKITGLDIETINQMQITSDKE
jgi:hypothetical protein